MKQSNQFRRFENPRASRTPFLILFCVIAIFVGAGGYGVYRHETNAIKQDKYNYLKAIGDLKASQITAWRKERMADARLNSQTPFLKSAIMEWLKADGHASPALNSDILFLMQLLRDAYAYDNIILTDVAGKLLLTLDPRLAGLENNTRQLVKRAISSKDVVFGDFFHCPDCGRIHLDVAAPIIDKLNRASAVLILRTDPEQFLFRIIQSWPLPSPSGECFLIRKDENHVLFLTPLRHRADAALNQRIPMTEADLPGVRAALGQTGLSEGKDYRGVEVLADIRSVPDTPWFMVVTVDADEIFSEANHRARLVGILTLSLMVLSGAAISYFYKRRGKKIFKALYQAEHERATAQEEFKTTLYSIGDAVITTDVKGNIRQMNPVSEALTGWKETEAKELPAEEVFKIVNESTGEKAENPVQKVLEKGLIVGLANHTLLIAKDGSEIPIADSGAPIRDEDGEITGVVLVFRDQGKEREVEKLILARLKLMEFAVSHSLDEMLQKTLDEVGAFTKSPIGFFHFVESDQKNLSLQAWSTRTIGEFCQAGGKGMHYPVDLAGVWVDCVHARNPVIHNDYGALPHKKGMPEGHAEVVRELVVPIIRADRIMAILGVGNKPSDYTEKDVEIVSYLADIAWEITERKRDEEKLRNLTSRQKALLSAIPDIVVEVDGNKVYTWANPAGVAFFGDDVVRKEAGDFFEGEQNTYQAVQPLFNGAEEVIYVESWQRRKDGKKRLLAWWCKVLKDENGRAMGAMSSARDITDQRLLEDQFIQAQKMESVGRLAGGVAHDFNNMLGVIIGHTEMAMEQVDSAQPVHEDLLEIQKAAQRSADLTRQLLAFARRQTVSPVVLDLNDTISGMLKMLRRLIGEDIDLVWKPMPRLWMVKIDPVQIDQILANLLVNAKDAISGVGAVTIETNNVVFDETYCEIHTGFIPGRFVMMAVSDSGSGMDKEILAHIFEPFDTTKEVGKGTGLGLATVYGVVKQNNGFINVYSEPGKGTSFKIYLPEVAETIETPKADVSRKELNGSETVLLVEDEEAILNLGKAILHRYGYTVLAAQTPNQALSLAENHQGPIHLLVTDVVMPQMNGRQLKEVLIRRYPEIRTLFMSGYTANAIAHHGVLEEGVNFLQKPFSVKTFAEMVRKTLESS